MRGIQPLNHSLADPENRGAKLAELARERLFGSHRAFLPREVRVFEPQHVLAVPFLVRNIIQQQSLFLVFEVEPSLRQRAELHELRKVRLQAYRKIYVLVDAFFVVVFEEEDGRGEHEYPIRAEFRDERPDIYSFGFVEKALFGFDADPHVVDAQRHHVVHAERRYRLCGREHAEVERPVVFAHERQQLHRPVLVKQEVLVHHEEVICLKLVREPHAHVEYVFARFQERGVLFVVEVGRAAESAGVRASHSGH
ncbi:MAG: hypothetical protein BWY28_03248 [bacterium ADurb.Bin236]|nr:MAG: hypothetical protein BWY28_03248 [bacterium ADurb.Bin236]